MKFVENSNCNLQSTIITKNTFLEKTSRKYLFSKIKFYSFKCKCTLEDLSSSVIGVAKNKKGAKSDSARKTIEMIAHIPDVQSVIISIMMSSNLNETLLF